MQGQETSAPTGNAADQTLSSDETVSAASHAAAPAVKDPRRLLAPARILVLLSLGLAVVSVGSDAMEFQFFHKLETGAFANDPEMMGAAEANDLRQMIVYVSYVVVQILTFIFVGRWIYFSSRNLRAFGAIGLTFRPGWAVGWNFIPIANLWKPYQAMKEIWQASSNPLDWRRQQIPSLMPVWWSFWVVAAIVDRGAARLAGNAATIEELQLAVTASITTGVIYAAACTCFVMLLNRISRLQIDAMDNKSTLAAFGP